MRNSSAPLALAALAFVVACRRGGSTVTAIPLVTPIPTTPTSVLNGLQTQTTIGSTVDTGTGAGSGDENPYGLAIAPVTSGKLTQGDLIICNFNNSSNV